MKLRWFLLLVIALSVLLTACNGKTGLRFNNETECGTATITITNRTTGNIQELTVDQGKKKTVELDDDVEYNYTVEYPRQPDNIVCDSKEVNTVLSDGQMLNITLKSVRAAELESTPTE